MRTARFLFVLASLAALLCFAAPAWADTISVPNDYKTIQEAVDAADRGDTVWVAAGVYEEVVTIDKALTLCGAGSEATIIDGAGKGHVIQVMSDDDIYIRRLAVRNGSMDWPYAGIDLYMAGGCIIEDCVATDVWAGIRFTYAHENVVRGCTFMDVECGVDVGDKDSYTNWILDCQAASCGTAAYNAYAGSDGLRILRSSAMFCKTGVQIGWSKGWTVEGCDIVGNGTGIVLDAADDGIIRYNQIAGSVDNGLWVAGPGSSGNHVYGNLFSGSGGAGVVLQGAATGNAIHDNRLQDCALGVDIMFNASSANVGNVFFRNTFWRNTLHARDDSGFTNPFNEAYPWGNWWDGATGTDEFSGPDQNVPGADGVFDEAFKLGNVVDKYPATTPDTTEPDTTISSGPDGVWVNIPTVTFEWKGVDDRTPPEFLGFSYSLDDAPWAFDGYSTWFFEDLAEGEHTFAVRARDGMGFDDPTPAIARFGVDLTAPRTEDSGDTAWHKTDTTVYFIAYDELSGVDRTEYSLNGGGTWTTGTEVTVPAPSDGSGDGVWSVLYRSVDAAGNVEPVRECVVKIAAAALAFGPDGTPVGGSGARVNDVALADLDGDADLDVIAGCDLGAGPELAVFENDGTSFVGEWPMHVVGDGAESVHSVAAADLDGDGDLDIVQGGGGAATVAQIVAWENDGTGPGGVWLPHPLGSVTSDAVCHAEVALADLDVDGWPDLVSISSAYGGAGQLAVWRNDQTPWDAPWSPRGLVNTYSMGSVATGAFDIGPLPDIAVSYAEGFVFVWHNPGSPFTLPWGSEVAGSGGSGMVSSIAVADFDDNGLEDFATSIGYLPSMTQLVWSNMGGGWPQTAYADLAATSVAAGDLDADGDVDLFSGNHGATPELFAHEGRTPSPWAGFTSAAVADLAAAVRDVALGDLDRDGDLDAVSGSDASPDGEVLAWQNLHTVDDWDPWSWSDYDWNWKNTSVDLALQADDYGSGVHHIEYKVGERGAWKVAPADIFSLGKRGWGGGQYDVYFRAVDNAGNVEWPNHVVVSVDGKPPRTRDDADDLWHDEDVTVYLDAQDDLSGVRFVRYSVDGASWQGGTAVTIAAIEDHSNDGVHEIRYYGVDWAGNRELTRTCNVMIDTTAPDMPLARAAREVRPAAARGPAAGARAAARLRVDVGVVDLASPRVALTVVVRDARGRVLERVRVTAVEAGEVVTLRFNGVTAMRAACVRIAARDQAGFARARVVRL